MRVASLLMELLVIRHARPVRGEGSDGRPADPDLSDLGRQQAEITAELLVAEGVDHVVSSTMKRALSTAEPLAERLDIEVEALDDLRESDHRASVYVPAEEFSKDDPATAHFFDPEANLHALIFPDGYEEFCERVQRGFDHVIDTNQSQRVAVFCHGMVTAVYLQMLLGYQDPFAVMVDYCGITRIAASSEGQRTVRSVNETQHVRHLLGR